MIVLHELINPEPHIRRGLTYVLKAILFLVHIKVNIAAILDFFLLNVLASNIYFWSTKLLLISDIIVNIFSGIVIVTVNI